MRVLLETKDGSTFTFKGRHIDTRLDGNLFIIYDVHSKATLQIVQQQDLRHFKTEGKPKAPKPIKGLKPPVATQGESMSFTVDTEPLQKLMDEIVIGIKEATISSDDLETRLGALNSRISSLENLLRIPNQPPAQMPTAAPAPIPAAAPMPAPASPVANDRPAPAPIPEPVAPTLNEQPVSDPRRVHEHQRGKDGSCKECFKTTRHSVNCALRQADEASANAVESTLSDDQVQYGDCDAPLKE